MKRKFFNLKILSSSGFSTFKWPVDCNRIIAVKENDDFAIFTLSNMDETEEITCPIEDLAKNSKFVEFLKYNKEDIYEILKENLEYYKED